MNITIRGVEYHLQETCGACPEAYDVSREGDRDNVIGKLRLRHGYFRATCYGDEVLETGECRGDGIFHSDERDKFLTMGVEAIHNKLCPPPERVHVSDEELRRLCHRIIGECTTDIQDFVTVAEALLERLC